MMKLTVSEEWCLAAAKREGDMEVTAGVPPKITAPWDPKTVDGLNYFQRLGAMHPFTCGNDHEGDKTLVATKKGWICPHCDYTQDWAHLFMATFVQDNIFK